ncbi:hypothetical protein IQ230_17170 [Gloeocapsopsis crepidinum LEGE 06123]|uniref:Uncharacterized protein n=1 Tax=Gloeocapsopsis crepidinum LEGE 06123 TaxID=588587 RepID=A0ABR9UUU4_9CHRO|nr:hypothetical protein [Gloeocapsopsis crepidinum]MBE9192051.1 hypothetical protein [Gloeocapsopsis crepidinum LEGE 06123]
MRKAILLIQSSIAFVLLLLLTLLFIQPAWASVCRNYDDRQICIISIERSAKNYWEYRVAISVDGVTRPVEIYNCRDRLIQQGKKVLPFGDNDPGDLSCSLLKNRR